MWGRRFDLLVSLLLLLILLVTGVTGLLADYLGVPRSIFHRYSAYILVLLAALHVGLNQPVLWARLKTALRTRRRTAPVPGPAEAGASPHPALAGLSRRTFLVSGAAGVAGFFLGRWLGSTGLPADLEARDLGAFYHQWSKPGFSGALRKLFQWGNQPPLYKEYGSPQRVSLPRDSAYRGLFVEEAIRQRRSFREYTGEALSLAQLSLLLHSASGLTELSYPLRASPSAGGLYPLELYPVVNNVENLASGAYHYRPADHTLDLLKEGNLRNQTLVALIGQDMVLVSSVVFVITAIFQRTRWKYQDRAYRYILLEAGHLAQNLYLAATSLNLGACAVGAFLDEELERLVGVDGENEAAIYVVTVGTR